MPVADRENLSGKSKGQRGKKAELIICGYKKIACSTAEQEKVVNARLQVSLCLDVFKPNIFVSEWPEFTVSAALITTHTAEDMRELSA